MRRAMLLSRVARAWTLLVVVGCGESDVPVSAPDASGIAANACGGPGPLLYVGRSASPADPCGACGAGRLVCSSPSTLICLGGDAASCPEAGVMNACGGSRELVLDGAPAHAGDACGPCNDGTVVCAGPDALVCVGAHDGAACGDAGTFDAPTDAERASDAADAGSLRGDVADPNACGGQGPLLWRGTPAKASDPCGPCRLQFSCASSTSLVCLAPRASFPCVDAGGPNDWCDLPASAFTAAGPTLPAPPSEGAPSGTTATTIALAANALVYNPFDFHLYASVGSSQGADGNSIAVIDPYAGSIVKSIFVGSEPRRMAISDDGTSLWVALDGTTSVRKVDLASWTAGQQFNVGSDLFIGVWYPRDVAVLPGTRDSVVVTRYGKTSTSYDGPVVYDNGVPRAYSSSIGLSGAVGVIMTYSPELVFAYGAGLPSLSTACVNANGYFVKKEASPFDILLQGQYAFVQNVIYTGSGVAYDIASATTLGTYAGRGPVAADASKRRVYFLSNTMAATVSAYDMDTFLLEGSETLSVGMNVLGDNFVLWGRYGYAFRAANLIVIARSTLVPAP
jgi:hypothetical protein